MSALPPALALLIALTALGCAPSGETRLEPVQRLIDAIDGDGAGARPEACAVDDEIRPALGCTPNVSLLDVHGRVVTLGSPPELLALPPALRARPFVLERRMWIQGRPGPESLPPILVPGGQTEIALDFPTPADAVGRSVDVEAWGRPVPPSARILRTRALPIGKGAVLRVGVGIDPVGVQVDAAPVEFRLVAASDSGEAELLRTTIDPRDPAARRWRDHAINLAAFSGRSLRFSFATRVIPREDQPPERAFSFPVWGAPQVLEPRRRRRPNVLLISIDTLRADHVGTYGCDLPTTPDLDRFAAQGTVFEQTAAPYPSTPPSHMSMFTGVYPAVHGVIDAGAELPAGIPTLTEILAGQGYQTAAVTEDGMLYGPSGFQRGFSYYRENKGTNLWDARGQVDATFAAGLHWVEAHRGERFFLFLHTYQVHDPYAPPPEFNLFTTYRADGVEKPIDQSTKKPIRDRHLYAGEVRYVDAELRRLLDGLDATQELRHTLVIVTSDHGEEFGEHGGSLHNWTLYDEVLRVPLILWGPGLVPAGARVSDQVSLVDLAPTILDLLNVPRPQTMQGESLLPLLRGEHGSQKRAVFAELHPSWAPNRRLLAVRTDAFKWIFYEGAAGKREIYDLRADPGEHRSLSDPDLLTRGEALLQPYRAVIAAAAGRAGGHGQAAPAPAVKLDQATAEKLRALGYVDALR